MSTAAEQPYAKVRPFGNNPTSIRGAIDLAELNGKTPVAYASDDTTQALITANPSESLILHIFTSTDDETTALDCIFTVHLEFDAEFSDPIQFAQS
jgi:hypothetical protein